MTQTNQTWDQWGQSLGKFYAQEYSSPDNAEGLPGTRKTCLPDAAPKTWTEWGRDLGEFYSAQYGNMPQFGQQKAQAWGEWGRSIGEYHSSPWTKHS